MDPTPEILSAEEMERKYGAFYQKSPKVRLDKSRVPEKFWPLIPYAEFWGIADDLDRDNLVLDAPPDVQKHLKDVVALHDNDLDHWLAGSEAHNPNPSDEYVAFSAMRMAADFV